MNCANHPQTPSTAFCRTCGKALCEECKRDVRGVIYCEDCIVARLGDALPPAATLPNASAAYVAGAATVPGAPNAALAAILGCIPFGIGAVYNGQYGKAFAHLITFALLIVAVDNAGPAEPLFGIAIAFFVVYQIFDAYRTAKAKQLGLPAPDPGGVYRSLGIDVNAGTTNSAATTASPVETPRTGLPFGAMVLIFIGFLFLLQNMGWFYFHSIGRLWPLFPIFFGVRMLMRDHYRHLVGPVAMITVGVLFLFSYFTPWHFRQTMPVLLIAIGVAMAVQRSGRTGGDAAPQPSTTDTDVTSEKR